MVIKNLLACFISDFWRSELNFCQISNILSLPLGIRFGSWRICASRMICKRETTVKRNVKKKRKLRLRKEVEYGLPV